MCLLVVGCGSNQTSTVGGFPTSGTSVIAATTLVAIQVTPDGSQLAVGTNQQYTATGIYANSSTATLTNVTWSSSNSTTVTINNSTGIATAVAPGEATITATYGGASGSAAVIVASKNLASVSLTPATASIAKGTTQQFDFVGTFSDGTTQDLTSSATWSSSNTAAATVNSLGLASGAGVGNTTIGATFQGFSATSTLSVTAAQLVSISVTSAGGPTIVAGTTVQLGATGTFSDGTTQNITTSVTWASSNTADATVTSTGLVTGVSAGTASITATMSGVVGTTSVTVDAVTIVSLTITPANVSVPLGTTTQISVVGVFNDNTTEDLTTQANTMWASSSTAIATVGNVSGSQGLVTPVAVGSTNVTATITLDGTTVSASSAVAVTPATLTSLSVTPADDQVTLGTAVTFELIGTYSDNTTQNLSANAVFSATPNVTTPGGDAASTVNASTGAFASNVTGTYNVTALYNVTTGPLNQTTATTNITVTQPPASGPLLFTGFYSGNVSAQTINPTTGALAAVTGYPVSAGSAPVWQLIANPVQSILYLSEWLYYPPNPTGAVSVSSLTIDQDGTVGTEDTAPNASITNSTTGDFAIVLNSHVAVFPYGAAPPAISTGNVIITPTNGDGTINTTIADSVNATIANPIVAMTSSNNFLFSSDGAYVYSYEVGLSGVAEISALTIPGITKMTVDPDGHFLVGIKGGVASNPNTNNLAVFAIAPDGSLSIVQQAVTHLVSAPTAVRTNGSLIFVLSTESTEFETFAFNPITYTLNSVGLQYSGNNPSDVDFDPTMQYLYVANYGDGTVSAFAITNGTTSTPTFGAVSGSPFTVGAYVTSVRVLR
jgi:uncharacterized protein YjdB